MGWSALRAEPQVPATPAPAHASAEGDSRGVLAKYCVSCHNDRAKTGGLSLEGLDPADAAASGEVLEKVVRKVRVGMMPPAGMPRPDPEASHAFVASLETALDRAGSTHPNPGRPMVHRLNRVEYAYAIKDLLDLEIDPVALLPPDETG